jgi:thiamine biosynthesis protein ThiS
MSKLKYFFLNGQQYSTNHNLTILELIEYFNYDTSLFVLEYNNQICNKKNWSNVFISMNDKLEIITIVGGG